MSQKQTGFESGRPTTGLRSLTTETTGKLEILGLDGDTLGVDGSQVGCELALQ